MDYDNVLADDENGVEGENKASISVLPDELLLHILTYLKFRDVLNLTSCLNKKFYELSKDPKLIPRSLTVNLFRSSDIERNVRYREQITEIITRASLLKTLSIEVNNNCHLNDELQLIGSGYCKVSIFIIYKLLVVEIISYDIHLWSIM